MKTTFNLIRVIAVNTFKEAVRDRILYTLILFALFMIMGSVLIGNLAIGGQLKIVKDMGLASISVFGMLIAIFIGIGLINKEIEKRTIYTILAKPISRGLFLLAKFSGLALVLLFEVLLMTIGFLFLIFIIERTFEFVLLKAIFLIYLELLVITAVAVLFSCFSAGVALKGIFCLAIYVAGHLTAEVKMITSQSLNSLMKFAATGFYYILPNLENFNIKSEVVLGTYVSWKYLVLSGGYAFLYITAVLAVATVIFKNRDFN
ncbi:MAG: ABC transporter permease subunit [Candidatus Omnitrophota bacterium]